MSITMTRTLSRVEVLPAPIQPGPGPDPEAPQPMIQAFYSETFDDPDDDFLPVSASSTSWLQKGDDLSEQDPLVVTIANAIWE